ncbi:hypothetical protein [Methylobacterium sp.]|jgi:hypothetical protein|uniref:hypothetical protein n=1 Tax=Methylobacterium sp. TaxID=409 RepID=UPI0025EE354C|nr:hypothetical protein [Methylobacterium sp.]MBY0257523.1 hypothetical protein [Methylobacterium sp.]
MNLDGAENAKAEVFMQAFRYREVTRAAVDAAPTFAPLPGTQAHADILRARRERSFDPKEKIAVGILKNRSDDHGNSALKVGLFLQHKKLLHHPVVEAAQRIAKGEVEVRITGRVRHRGLVKAKPCRPLRMGHSVGHHRITAGTIGCFGIDRDGRVGILSNNHVLANTNRARVGDIILQPGRADGGRMQNADHHVAKLEAFVPIDFDPMASNLVDCAFARLDPGRDCVPNRIDGILADADGWDISDVEDLLIEQTPVKKVGRTTDLREGLVEAIDVDNIQVQMITGARPRFAMFNRQVVISGTGRPFSQGGDSGALICTQDGRPAALLFAGTESGGLNGHGITYANPIRSVLDALEIEIYTQVPGA